MRTFDYSMIVKSGFIGFAVAAVLSGLCYLVAIIGARLVSSSPRDIPFARLAFTFLFVLAWFLVYLPYSARAHAGNLLDPGFWYHVARVTGSGYGAVAILAWFIVAIIECFRKKPMPPQSPDPTAVGAVSSAVAVRVASRR